MPSRRDTSQPPGPDSATMSPLISAPPTAGSSSMWYLHHLDAHIVSSHKHVQGQPSSAYYHTPVGQFASLSTVVPPTNSIWTPEEKSLFFAALSRHSRYRTDLIARDVGTKNEAEVGWYIALLDSGSEKRKRADRTEGQSSGIRDRRARWDGSLTWREGLAPAAREVAHKRVEREEELAETISFTLREVDDHAERSAVAKRRRMERNEANSAIRLDPSLNPYDKRRVLVSDPHLAELRQKWMIEDWGDTLNTSKLDQLNTLLIPEWQEWYGRRLRTPSPTGIKKEVSSPSDSESEDHTPAIKSPTTKVERCDKIARENREYAALAVIAKKDRTPEQRKRLTVILNRKRNREEYRTKKLLGEGMTAEEIEKAGGADAIYSSRAYAQKILEDGFSSHRKPGLTKKREDTPINLEEDIATANLKRMGMYDYVLAHGLEVFNYRAITKMIGQRESSPNPSFPILCLLHAELDSYLHHLLYRAMTIAEQAFAQLPSAIDGLEDDIKPEMTAEHVRQALAFEGAGYFFDSEVNKEDGDQRADHELSPAAGPARKRREQYSELFLSPNHLPWGFLPSLSTTAQDRNIEARGQSNGEDDNKTSSDEEDEDDFDFTKIEEEDVALDRALDAADREHDKRYEKALWATERGGEPKGGEKKVLVDLGASWVFRSTQWTGEHTRKVKRSKRERGERKKRNRSTVPVEEELELMFDLVIILDYIGLLLSTGIQRRKRRLDETRHNTFPTTRLKKIAAARGFGKSEAFIIDSESDDEGVWDDERPESEEGNDSVGASHNEETEGEMDEEEDQYEHEKDGRDQDTDIDEEEEEDRDSKDDE